MSRSSFVPHVARRWVWFGGYALIVVGVGVFTNALRRSLNSDEANYYFPAICFFHLSLPFVPVRDYPFPGPPLALGIQALIFGAVGGSIAGLRALFSTVAALVTGLLLFRNEKDDGSTGNARRLGTLVILTFPYFLWNTFTLKHHTFSAGLIMGALALWRVALKQGRWTAWLGTSVLLCAAMLTTQLCLPLCAALMIASLWEMNRNGPWKLQTILLPLAAAGVPVMILGGFMLLWGGVEPPLWRSSLLLENEVAGFHFNAGQCMLALISLGAWFAPGVLRSRREWLFVAVALVPCGLIISACGLYANPDDFWHTGMGPVSLLLQKVWSASEFAGASLSGFLAAMGLVAWLEPGFSREWNFFARVYTAIFIAVMCFTVPYLFESYYLLLLVPLLWIARFARKQPPDGWAIAFLIAQCAAGIGYAVFKLLALNS